MTYTEFPVADRQTKLYAMLLEIEQQYFNLEHEAYNVTNAPSDILQEYQKEIRLAEITTEQTQLDTDYDLLLDFLATVV